MVIPADPIIPMEPSPAAPTEMPRGPEWAAQVKWDGVRVLAYGAEGALRLYNRRRRERTPQYPELADLPELCAASSFVLDGEMVALGDDGRPSFHEIMRRDGLRRCARLARLRPLVPVFYMVFDLLFCDGEWIVGQPLAKRQERLRDILPPAPHVHTVSFHDDAVALFEAVRERDMEGIVVKRLDSVYRPGARSRDWVKIKHDHDLVAVVGGFTTGSDGHVNGLYLGRRDGSGELVYVGNAGAGRLEKDEWRALGRRLGDCETDACPFAQFPPKRAGGARWVAPVLAVKVRFAAWTPEGFMRQPVIQALVRAFED